MDMDERERIRTAIKQWEEKELPELIERKVDLRLFTKLPHIIDIIGARRSGKTYLMYWVIKKLLEKGFDKNSLIYINFENRALYPLNEKLLEELLNYIFEKRFKKIFLFLDEIHNVKTWEKWARNVYDEYRGKIKTIISGSTSKITKGEVATLLTGRHIPIIVYPLNFEEFLKFKEFTFKKDDLLYSTKKQAELRTLLNEYLTFGGFPEIVLIDNALKKDILNAYYDDFLQKDVIEKFKIRETTVLENFVKFLFLNISSYFSYKRGKDYMASHGIVTSTRTLLNYTSILEEAFLFFFIPIFSKRVKDQLKYPRKIYCVDVGLRSIVSPFSEDYGKVLENLVFLELKRDRKEIYYWKKGDKEVDFVVKEGLKITQIIQVSWQPTKKETKKREILSLVEAMREFRLKRGIVITENYESTEKFSGIEIKFIPFWKWALKMIS